MEVLSAHCSADRVRFPYSPDDIVGFSEPSTLKTRSRYTCSAASSACENPVPTRRSLHPVENLRVFRFGGRLSLLYPDEFTSRRIDRNGELRILSVRAEDHVPDQLIRIVV